MLLRVLVSSSKQSLIDSIIDKLSRSKSWALVSFFSYPNLLLEANPDTQLHIISATEKKIFGPRGIRYFEAQHQNNELLCLCSRSLAQHLCQQAQIPSLPLRLIKSTLMLVSLPPLLFYLFLATVRNYFSHHLIIDERTQPPSPVAWLAAERFRSTIETIYQASEVRYLKHKGQYFWIEELAFFCRCLIAKSHLIIHPRLISNLFRWLAFYGYVRKFYAPTDVISFVESVSSSSLLTAYLHSFGIRHINVTHGERILTANNAFAAFDEDHLWGEYFKEIAQTLRAPEKSLKISGNESHRLLFWNLRALNHPRPKRLVIIHNPQMTSGNPNFYTLVSFLKKLDPTWKISVRNHPDWKNHGTAYFHAIQSIIERSPSPLPSLNWEDANDTPLSQTLANSKILLGDASAALIEAWMAGCRIIYLHSQTDKRRLLERHRSSSNVFYLDESAQSVLSAIQFVNQTYTLNQKEEKNIRYVSKME